MGHQETGALRGSGEGEGLTIVEAAAEQACAAVGPTVNPRWTNPQDQNDLRAIESYPWGPAADTQAVRWAGL